MTMKKIISLILLACSVLSAQNAKLDTTKIGEPLLNFAAYFNPLRFLPDSYFDDELINLNQVIHLPADTASILMQARMQLAMFNTYNPFDAKTNLLNPLYNNYMAGRNHRLMQRILGAVQVGAVGILAYKHIEKYYIKKKK
ncbi:MAG: hypothetical protein FD143_2043 [Ignavibacteria bacterium]|nr:MAG: hypothetical protein FD143_2043 [Ignavibacteria bacterium]KAF0159103.1 MAG: hypothetical protein FD188_2266 [Ignavibacteria bacterium]